MSEAQTKCVCNDETMHKDNTCMKCGQIWSRQLEYHERVAKCPEHRFKIAICGPGTLDCLCKVCEDNGWYVETSGHGFMPNIEIKRK